MCNLSYPLFVPPRHLATKARESWTKREAEEYFEWFTGIASERVRTLREKLGLGEEASLLQLGKAVQGALACPDICRGEELTDAGLALGADSGLFVAQRLLEVGPSLRWEIVRKPRSHISYNLPVLRGFASSPHAKFDPVLIGTNMVYRLASGKPATEFEEAFRNWVRHL